MFKVYEGPAVWDGSFSLIGVDDVTGEKIWVQLNDDGSFVAKRELDVETLMKRNAFFKEGTEGRAFGDFRHIGSVPDAIAEQSGLNEAWKNKDMKFVKKFFNDGDNAAWRTSRGKA